MEKLLNGFLSKASLSASKVKFLFDGQVISPSTTPEDLDMEDGDLIDAVVVS